jgi:hypothetical protein
MEGTLRFTLDHTMAWVTNPQERNTCWFYGLPEIGEALLAHSIRAGLRDQ